MACPYKMEQRKENNDAELKQEMLEAEDSYLLLWDCKTELKLMFPLLKCVACRRNGNS